VIPCVLIGRYQRFGGTYHLHCQGEVILYPLVGIQFAVCMPQYGIFICCIMFMFTYLESSLYFCICL
jgi:hypothetical protein